jgi:hypothetical protein
MDVYTSPAEWPEWQAFVGAFQVRFRRPEGVVAVRTACQGSMGPTATTPAWQTAQRLHTVPRWPWRTVRWRRGTKGWRRKKFVAVRSWRVASDGQRHVGWMIGERATRGQPEERKS